MPINIPELQGYFGGKGGSGVYQNIINLIPPHQTFVVPFLGHCGIVRNIAPASQILVNDIDPFVINSWKNHFNTKDTEELAKYNIWFHNSDWYTFLQMWERVFEDPHNLIYLDPPYPHSSRKSDHRYKFEMTDNDHRSLLYWLTTVPMCKVIISTYKNPMYQEGLKGWNKHRFQAKTRRGMATETVYYNYPNPDQLHDYRYFGTDYKNREHFKLKRDRLVKRFEKMSLVERNFYMDALQDIAPPKNRMMAKATN